MTEIFKKEVSREEVLGFYRQPSAYTSPGPYEKELRALPDEIREIGALIRAQLIPPVIFKLGNTYSNQDLRYGDMRKIPWHHQPEDDIFPTAAAITAELFRRDKRGLTAGREEENRLILSCRLTALLVASVLKSKGIPARVRSGFAPYFEIHGNRSVDHWINQYWDEKSNRWVTVDVDGSIEPYLKLDPYDIPEAGFDFPARVWLLVRQGKLKGNRFWNQAGWSGLAAVSEALFADFHCLMNHEIVYWHYPRYAYARFNQLTDKELGELDELAEVMEDPDGNFAKLRNLWETKRKFRNLKGGLLK
jgi:hypothetical protein